MAEFVFNSSSNDLARQTGQQVRKRLRAQNIDRLRAEGVIPPSLYVSTDYQYAYDELAADWAAIALEISRRYRIPTRSIGQAFAASQLPSDPDELRELTSNLWHLVQSTRSYRDLLRGFHRLSVALPPGKPPSKPPKPPPIIR